MSQLSESMAAIPNRPVFRAQEVCEIAQVQPYVLRSWEAEFPDLGVSKAGAPRVYRRADVERVLELKHLLFVDGLTLAGARKRLGVAAPAAADSPTPVADADVAVMIDRQTREHLRDVRRGLQWILGVLDGGGVSREDRALLSERPSRPSRPARSASRARARRSAARSGKPARKPSKRQGK